jgi:hypothetical protein
MKRSLFYFLLAMMPFITGCETDADNVRVPGFEQKLVVTGFLSPSDTVSFINVRSNWPIYGLVDTELGIGNITGYLSNGTEEIQLETIENGFRLDHRLMDIEYGRRYALRVVSDKGLTAEATCNVPGKKSFVLQADTFSVKVNTYWSPDPNDRQVFLKVSVIDIAGEENYYSLGIRGWTKSPVLTGYSGPVYSINASGPYFIRSDKNIDGQKITWDNTYANFNYFYKADSASLVIYLYHTEKDYYLFHRSLNSYGEGDNPFSEATPVYTNVKGGLGVFTSYTVDSLVFPLK